MEAMVAIRKTRVFLPANDGFLHAIEIPRMTKNRKFNKALILRTIKAIKKL